jgi:hypothetical protein
VGFPPTGVTKIWKAGPPAGGGVHRKAHPMFQLAAVVVKAVLVQLPDIWAELSSTRAGPAAAVVVDEAEVVVVVPPAAVVVVLAPFDPVDVGETVVEVVEPDFAGGGRL